MSFLLIGQLMMSGCASGPIFQNIESITVHRQDSKGTRKEKLTGKELDQVASCLYRTKIIPDEDANEPLLGSVLLMEVKDGQANRMFELFTQENFKGNKGKTYSNRCLYSLIAR